MTFPFLSQAYLSTSAAARVASNVVVSLLVAAISLVSPLALVASVLLCVCAFFVFVELVRARLSVRCCVSLSLLAVGLISTLVDRFRDTAATVAI
jgi:hypothetical protein